MPAPVKWSADDFELVNAESPEGEPWLAASLDGRFRLTFYESFPTASPAYSDIETRLYTAAGIDTGLTTAPTFSATTTDHQPVSAFMPDGREVVVWTEEPAAGGGDHEDVYAAVYVGNLVAVPRFLVSGGAGRQHDPVVATNGNGFVIALADNSVAGGRLILKFYNAVGGLTATINAPDAPEGVQITGVGSYRDVEITALANGNYAVTWADNGFDIWARVFSGNGAAQTGLIEIDSGGLSALFPDVTALADGRFLVTYGLFDIDTVRGRIFEANGTPSTDPFTISTNAVSNVEQQVQTAALQDGRFVTVWVNIFGRIEGQVMFADGTPDGATFTVNGDGAGGKGRPTIATLADGRFAVSWESGAGAAQTIFTTIFDPREAGVDITGTTSADDYIGTSFADTMLGGGGNDRLDGAGGNDVLNGGAGIDTMIGGLGNDTYYVDHSSDLATETGGGGTNDRVFASASFTLGANVEFLQLTGTGNINGTGNASFNTLLGNSGANKLDGQGGADVMTGGLGNDVYVVDSGGDVVTELAGGGTADRIESNLSITALLAQVEDLTLLGSANLNGVGNAAVNRIVGNSGANTLNGLAGADFMSGGDGNDLYVVDTALDTVIELAGEGTADRIDSFVSITALAAEVEVLTLLGTASVGTGNALENRIIGNSGANILDGSFGVDTLVGDAGSDVYIVDSPADIVTELAGGGTDRVESSTSIFALAANVENLTLVGSATIGVGNALSNLIIGNIFGNTLNGLAGADHMSGGFGNDTYVVDQAGDLTTEFATGGTADMVQSSVSHVLGLYLENLALTGAAAINGTGNTVANILTGNNAANTLDGMAGADFMSGGAGNDVYIVDSAGDSVTESVGGGTADRIESTVTISALAAEVENLLLLGTSNLNGTGNALANRLTGNSGNNILDGLAGVDILTGGAGNDVYRIDAAGETVFEAAGGGTDRVESLATYTLSNEVENLTLLGSANINGTGNALANIILGNTGDNVLNGGPGADFMSGGAGNDTYGVDNAGDTVFENNLPGTDVVLSSVSFTLALFVETLFLVGTSAINGTGNIGVNSITGNIADNVLDGGSGADTLTGGGGNDTFIVDSAGDTVSDSSGTADHVRASVTRTLESTIENLTLTGVSAINGTGNTLANILLGNGANNILDGKTGADVMTGGLGADRFQFTALGGSVDQILDFTHLTDKIAVSALTFGGGLVAGGPVVLTLGAAAVGAGVAQFIYDGATGSLGFDSNGSTAGGFTAFATLTTLPTLTTADFVVVA